jgi:hypothetical protein
MDLQPPSVPVDGKPLKATLPVGTAQVGCVIVPTAGVAAFTTVTATAEVVLVQNLML